MLLKLLIFRFGPFGILGFLKERRQIKLVTGIIVVLYTISFLITVWKIFSQERLLGVLVLPISMFPQYIFYVFSICIVLRCIWQIWSERVWKRIYFLSILSVLLGILAENYINTKILQIFFKIFK